MLKLAAMELAPAPAPSATELKSNGGGKPVANSAGTPGLPLVLGFHMVGLAAVITVLICSGHLEHLHLHGLHGLGETAMVAALLLPTLLNVQQPRLRAALLVAHRLAFLALPQLLGGPAGLATQPRPSALGTLEDMLRLLGSTRLVALLLPSLLTPLSALSLVPHLLL
ncbi:pyridoxal-5 -phosphate-dependent subunit beta [Micractinium conductrix]|uniref:Pyridoxal-5 -phosphate-dependent subunit beta n=1 Tax=Micractinium conductrix TaxID=554055 RepID=A0A2P6VM73_9CHLO|nr:pyridoxal-5 -phosphate-dependent subunit beta [Micractinium conductrix]|eukprot:PSC75202.1 pyridoxal-5 -phosphate-dependent subunit beta [Micractinium conductrix]